MRPGRPSVGLQDTVSLGSTPRRPVPSHDALGCHADLLTTLPGRGTLWDSHEQRPHGGSRSPSSSMAKTLLYLWVEPSSLDRLLVRELPNRPSPCSAL